MEHKPNEPSPIKPTNLFLGNHNLYKYKPSKTLSREHHTNSTKKKKEKIIIKASGLSLNA